MLHIYMKYEAPHSLSTGENMFLANLSQHKQHDTMDVAEIWSPYHGGWQTHHQTFEFQKKNNLPSFFPWNATPKKDKKKSKTAVFKKNLLKSLCVCVFFDVFLCWLLPTWKNLGNHGPYLHHMGSWRCEKPRDPLDSTSKMTRWIGRENLWGRGGWFTEVVETVGNVYIFFLPTHKSCQF